jgi:hypothetical protein
MNPKKMALGYKTQTFDKKLVGIVDVITGDKVAKFTLTEEGKKFKDGSTSIKLNLADLPKRPALKANNKTPLQFRIRMNSDGDRVEAITPVRGYFRGRLIDLGKRPSEGADPAPYEKVWNEGTPKENRYMEFFAVYEITDGPYKGVQLPAYNLRYKFEESPEEEGFTRFDGDPNNPKATRLHQLVEWGEYHGEIWSQPIRWPDDGNILPELLDRVLENDLEVNLVIDKGYIQSIQPVEDAGFESVDVEDEDAAAVDEMLDGDDEEVKPIEIKPKAAPKSKAVKKSPAKAPVADADDDL